MGRRLTGGRLPATLALNGPRPGPGIGGWDMMRDSRWIVWGCLLLVTSESRGQAETVGLVDVGAARVDVTPSYPIRLGGYLVRTGESAGVSQRIWAKALAIGSDEQGPAVVVAVDSLGVGANVVEEVAARLARSTKLSRERFVVASSHSHSTPCLVGVAPNIFGKKIDDREQATIARYTRELTDAIERVAVEALRARRPARLAWAEGSVRFAANRRTPGGPVDHSLPVLTATAPDGTIRAVLVNYACHCTTLDPKQNTIGGDWAGFAQAAIEADHPGAVALTLIGCGADANPLKRLDPAAAASHGRALADEVNRLLRGPWKGLPAPPTAALERFTIPFDTLPTRTELERLVKAGGAPGYNASVQLARLDRGESLQSRLDYSAQAWRFGDALAMVFLPGEVVVDYVLRLKKELDPGRLWVTAYANDVPCYIPSERILGEGGYEGGGAMVYFDRPTRLKPGLERIIVEAVHRVVTDRFKPPVSAPAGDESPLPRSPEEARRAFRLKPGFRVELVASEPLVESPVAVDFGADGRLWVCEMRDYPTGIDGNWKPGGVIKYLEDTDADGRFDKATVFLDGLPFPTGVMAWRNGVLVCAAPEILYAEDTDGDGKADVRRVLFHGFATENYQARVNGLSYGLDDWVYGANGLIGGTIRGTATGREVNIGGRDFRIKPDTGVMEPASGLTQQGRVHDDWGNQFGGNNSILLQHYPLTDHDARRNPWVAAPAPAVYVPRDADSSRIFPASVTLARYNHPESANRVTSACSPLIYRDDLLGPEFKGNAFVCEPVHNLVHREVLEPDGVTFAGHRAAGERESEFFASTDAWCRPVQVRTGPDGALWVVDMYRFVIEHPRWISPERLATLDVRAGADRGRIYRVYHEARPPRAVPRLQSLSTPRLAASLDSPNGTLRDTVQRLLAHRGERDALPTLRELVRSSTRPEARAQALATLDALRAVEPGDLLTALADARPGVRREAVRVSGSWLGRDRAVETMVLRLADDPVVTVRFQVALALGGWDDAQAGQALGRIARKDGRDDWVRAAVLSSSSRHAEAILEAVVSAPGDAGPPAELVEPLIATLAASQDRREVARALAAIRKASAQGAGGGPWRIGATAQLLDAVRDPALGADPVVRPMFEAARVVAVDASAPPSRRAAALRLLGRKAGGESKDRDLIAARLDPTEPIEVQLATVRALSRLDDRPALGALTAGWRRLGPGVRSAILDALLAGAGSAEALVEALESGEVAPREVDAAHRLRLLTTGSDDLRKRAAAIFQAQGIGPRQAVLARYSGPNLRGGDPSRGKATFIRVCATCHKLGDVGHEVGPDLAALTDTTPEALTTAILDPDRDVDARYATYTAALKDGRVLTGLVASETASAITLKRQEGQTDVILRADIDELKTAGRSLMPEGLENDVKPSELADLVAYLAQGEERPKVLDGNRPQTVVQGADRFVRLPASAAEVYGPTLTFEPETRNLGYWHSQRDRAAWTFRVDRPGTYTVSMEWACADESAGNPYFVRVGPASFRGTIGGTGAGTWANFRSIFLSEVVLPVGTHRLEFRADGPVRGALLDLRAVVLSPRTDGVGAKPR